MHPASALEQAVGHVEITPHYNTTNNTWDWKSYWFDQDLNSRDDAINTLHFPGFNTTPANFGVLHTRPSASKWDFFGVAAGQPIYIFTDTSYTSAGFASTQAELSGEMSFSLDSVTGPEGGHFSMYSGSTPNIYMQTLDGISSSDVFLKPLSHTHVQWAFSKKGLWTVNLKVQGTLKQSGLATTQSPPQPIVFAIGDHAIWKAANFTQPELANSNLSGDDSDPDQDGLSNLMEYALGGNPHSSSPLRTNDSQPLAPRLIPPSSPGDPWMFCYFSRKMGDGVDISYTVQSSSNLAADSWIPELGTAQMNHLDDEWDEIAIPLSSPPTGTNKRFFQLKVSVIP